SRNELHRNPFPRRRRGNVPKASLQSLPPPCGGRWPEAGRGRFSHRRAAAPRTRRSPPFTPAGSIPRRPGQRSTPSVAARQLPPLRGGRAIKPFPCIRARAPLSGRARVASWNEPHRNPFPRRRRAKVPKASLQSLPPPCGGRWPEAGRGALCASPARNGEATASRWGAPCADSGRIEGAMEKAMHATGEPAGDEQGWAGDTRWLRDERGRLLVGDRVLDDVVAEIGGTPCYLLDRGRIERRVAMLRECLPASVELHYAIKANPLPELVAWLAARVDGFDVASAGELELALAAGMSPQRISFAGPGKSASELALAHAHGVLVNVESFREIGILAELGARDGTPARVALRVN